MRTRLHTRTRLPILLPLALSPICVPSHTHTLSRTRTIVLPGEERILRVNHHSCKDEARVIVAMRS